MQPLIESIHSYPDVYECKMRSHPRRSYRDGRFAAIVPTAYDHIDFHFPSSQFLSQNESSLQLSICVSATRVLMIYIHDETISIFLSLRFQPKIPRRTFKKKLADSYEKKEILTRETLTPA